MNLNLSMDEPNSEDINSVFHVRKAAALLVCAEQSDLCFVFFFST